MSLITQLIILKWIKIKIIIIIKLQQNERDLVGTLNSKVHYYYFKNSS